MGRLPMCLLCACALHSTVFLLPGGSSRPGLLEREIEVTLGPVSRIQPQQAAAAATGARAQRAAPPVARGEDQAIIGGMESSPESEAESEAPAGSPGIPIEGSETGDDLPSGATALNVDARPVTPIAPAYPRRMRELGREGTVRILATVDADGSVLSAVVAASSGFSMLDNAAAAAVRRAVFSPAQRGGVPVASLVLIPIRFSIADAQSDR
jgi:protein TonB